jgi:transposase-like protein
MELYCPFCKRHGSDGPKIVKFGFFRRRSDGELVQRFRCCGCLKSFSKATSDPCYQQNKRQLNEAVRQLFCSGVSQRRLARLLKISRITVVRKLLFLADQAYGDLRVKNAIHPLAEIVEFDDMETFEHTKCKPVSITLAVEAKSRRILGFQVSQMPAKGLLARISVKKYGFRKDERKRARKILFESLVPLVHKTAKIKSDENPHYAPDVKKFFPDCEYEAHKGRRGSIVGQGELKKIRFDPLFSINHTCAMLRANINRLFRRTWCTTKRIDRLSAHIAIYAVYHNEHLKI